MYQECFSDFLRYIIKSRHLTIRKDSIDTSVYPEWNVGLNLVEKKATDESNASNV